MWCKSHTEEEAPHNNLPYGNTTPPDNNNLVNVVNTETVVIEKKDEASTNFSNSILKPDIGLMPKGSLDERFNNLFSGFIDGSMSKLFDTGNSELQQNSNNSTKFSAPTMLESVGQKPNANLALSSLEVPKNFKDLDT
jgi:hypothetical protein